MADNSVRKVIDTLLRNDLILIDELGFPPLDATGAQLLLGSSQPPNNAGRLASHRTGTSSPGDGSYPNTPPRSACSTDSCATATPSSPTAIPTACDKQERREEPDSRPTEHQRRVTA